MNIADGEIGITTDFESVVLGSSPSPRTSAPDLALYGDESAGDALTRRRSTYSSRPLPSPCRLCGGPTWLQDEEGSIHPCCELSRVAGGSVDADGLLVCPSCKASEKLNREQRRRHG